MASPGFGTMKSTSTGGWLLILLPVQGQKVKGVSPSAFEVLIRGREEKPAGTANRTAITARFRHEVDARL